MSRIVALVVTTSLLTGCAALGNLIAQQADGQGAQFEAMGDYDAAAKKAPGDLKLLETMVGTISDHSALNAIAAKNYGAYAFGFIEPVTGPLDLPDPKLMGEAKAWYRRGREAGLKALRTNAEFKKAEEADIEAFTAALKSFGPADVPSMFWTAYCWGQLVLASKDDPELVAELPRVLALIDRVKQVDPGFYHGSAHAFEMVNAASRPKLLGGDPAVAKAAYDKAVSVDGRTAGGAAKFLTHDVMFAQFYAVQNQDPKLFKDTLERALATPADVLPAAQLANVIAKRRAQVLLSKIADFFPDLEEEPATE
jgi:hypothetical protein